LQLYGAPCHFLAVCVPLWTGSFFMAGWDVGKHSLDPPTPDLTPLDFLYCGFVTNVVYHEKVQSVHDRTVITAECLNTVMLISTWRETISSWCVSFHEWGPCWDDWAHKKPCEVKCLKMYRFLQHIFMVEYI
jgi:hypothetical protein